MPRRMPPPPPVADLIFFLVLVGTSCLLPSVECLVESSSVSCSVRREISPCTCHNKASMTHGRSVVVACERMTGFGQVLDAVKYKFEPDVQINMKISYSVLDDLSQGSFRQTGLKITYFDLHNNNISLLPDSVFSGIGELAEYLGLSDNPLGGVPRPILALMPRLKVLDLKKANITNITSTDFQGLKALKNLFLTGNEISLLEEDSLPTGLHRLHLGTNRITSLNGTVRKMSDLEWLIISRNRIESLGGQLPSGAPNDRLRLLLAEHNRLKELPNSLHNLRRLDYANFQNNRIIALGGALAKSKCLNHLNLEANNISVLAENDFSELGELKELLLGRNRIEHLNQSLVPLKKLQFLNLTYNRMEHFSFQELAGLKKLRLVDLSHNDLHVLTSQSQNQIESEVRVVELRLQYNKLRQLSGALSGLAGLNRLNLSHNLIETIQPNDLVGLGDLKILDVSYNRLLTLEETSKTVLPGLEELRASHNAIRVLEHDFHGLPRLCWADLSHNTILTMDPHLTDNTQCQLHGVNSTLRIYLNGNPILCDPLMDVVMRMIEQKNVEIRGTTRCEELITTTVKPTTTVSTAPTSVVVPTVEGTTPTMTTVESVTTTSTVVESPVTTSTPVKPPSTMLETNSVEMSPLTTTTSLPTTTSTASPEVIVGDDASVVRLLKPASANSEETTEIKL